MKLYKLKSGLLIKRDSDCYLLAGRDWDNYVNDDRLFEKLREDCVSQNVISDADSLLSSTAMTPIGSQELWACGVTYLRSKSGREAESKTSGASDFYARVYEAERPEVFFKANPHRIVGDGEKVAIRSDSTWNVPEPELTLVVTSSGKIVGYTIGNDMSSRSIEGENPLYLPQAKTYDACAAIGPCIYVPEKGIDKTTSIHMAIHRKHAIVFEDCIRLNQMKRSEEELVSYVYRACSFPTGAYILTGTGIVPGNDFTLHQGDTIQITIDVIGTLTNTVK